MVIDLEDAVAASSKEYAREAVAKWLRDEHRSVVLRINSIEAGCIEADLAICRMRGISAIMIPKVQTLDSLHRIREEGGNRVLLPLIETAQGIDRVRSIAAVPGVARLFFGSLEFQLDMRISVGPEELLPYCSALVLASRLANRPAPVDGASMEIQDLSKVRDETRMARRQGFGGKLCVHPRQVSIVNAWFPATTGEIIWARRVMEAALVSEGAAVAVDGKMVDRPVIRRAEAILAQASEEPTGGPTADGPN